MDALRNQSGLSKIQLALSVLVGSTRGVNRAEISGPARKIFVSARPGPQSMYHKICTVQLF